MPYLFLLLALIGGLTKGFSGKKVSRDVCTLYDGFTVNTLRTLFCSLIGLLIALCKVGTVGLLLTPHSFLVCLISSVSMAAFSVCWLYAYKSEAYMFLSVFTMLASVLTAILGWAIYGDSLKLSRIIGFAILFLSVYIMSFYNKSISGKITKRAAVTLVLGGIGAALSDFMQKVYTKESLGDASAFTFYTYFLVLFPHFIILLFLRRNKAERNPILLDRRHIIIFFIMSAALYLNVLAKTVAAKDIPATQMYPTLQGANLIASTLLVRVLFKEKIKASSAAGIILALIAVVLMNM